MTKIIYAAIFACTMLPSVAGATTQILTFDQLEPSGPIPIYESGYVYTNHSSYEIGGSWAFHDDDGGMVASTIKRQDGQQFDALGMEFSGQTYAYKTGSQDEIDATGAAGAKKHTYGYVQLSGYRDGIPVVSETIFGNANSSRFTFSSLFTGLTALEVTLSESYRKLGWSYFSDGYPLQPNTIYCKNPGGWAQGCEGVQIDNLALRSTPSPVPLPAALSMLLVALGGLGIVARRRKAA